MAEINKKKEKRNENTLNSFYYVACVAKAINDMMMSMLWHLLFIETEILVSLSLSRSRFAYCFSFLRFMINVTAAVHLTKQINLFVDISKQVNKQHLKFKKKENKN